MNCSLKKAISQAISEASSRKFVIHKLTSQSGGCINETWIAHGNDSSYFIKLNSGENLQMFQTEAAALREIISTNTIRAPHPITFGSFENRSFLVLEALAFGPPSKRSWQVAGRELARLHLKCATQFGWDHSNTIGANPQSNSWTEKWSDFFRDQRLKPQIELARRNSYRLKHTTELLDTVDSILGEHHPSPSMLHGDLWSGNIGFLTDGSPAVFDPATYYGDRETDIAFSEFFGGFPESFYKAYNEEWPLSETTEQRKLIYNLYHVLNHANLFGGGYVNEAEEIIRQLI